MFQLIYGSSAIAPMNEKAIMDILNTAREKNSELNITGLLLYKDGNFLQVLEGEKEAVKQLFGRISEDERHTGVMTYVERDIEDREFEDWSMGFVNLEKFDVKSLEGYSPILESNLNVEDLLKNPSYATAFIRAFARRK